KLLLIDEDTAATNFMIRDRRMQQLIAKTSEPITPFVDKVEQLYREHQVSTILVMGGSGDYFEAANTVIAMENFEANDLTAQAKAIAAAYDNIRLHEGGQSFGQITPRTLSSYALSFKSKHQSIKYKAKGTDLIAIAQEQLD
ncbi:MAG: ATPase, partial [Phototrophicales bacterium]